MTDLNGSLESIGLAPLLEFLRGVGVSGRLSLIDGSLFGALYLESGRVVGAVFDAEAGASAFESIVLLLGSGRFELTSDVDRQLNFMAEPDEVDRQLKSLSAERDRLARAVPSVAAIPRPLASGSAETDDPVTIDLGTLRLWLEFDGRRSVANVAQGRSMLRTVRAVSQLVELGLLECDAGIEPVAAPTPRPDARTWSVLDRRGVSQRAK